MLIMETSTHLCMLNRKLGVMDIFKKLIFVQYLFKDDNMKEKHFYIKVKLHYCNKQIFITK